MNIILYLSSNLLIRMITCKSFVLTFSSLSSSFLGKREHQAFQIYRRFNRHIQMFKINNCRVFQIIHGVQMDSLNFHSVSFDLPPPQLFFENRWIDNIGSSTKLLIFNPGNELLLKKNHILHPMKILYFLESSSGLEFRWKNCRDTREQRPNNGRRTFQFHLIPTSYILEQGNARRQILFMICLG